MGGSVTPTSIEVTYNEKYGELATPTRTGYIFGGWYTLPTCLEANKITSETIVKTIENQTLYAKWTEEVCNNITKSVTCTKTCVNGTNASGTRVNTYNCRGNLVSTGVCNATCSNYTKTNSCSIKCGSGNVNGTRVDTYNGNMGSLISTGTCNATCPAGPSGATLTVTSGSVNNYNTTYVTLKSTVTSGATISKYEFYNGSNLLGTKTTSSKSTSITVNTLTSGNMSFRVVVTDIYGRTATSSVTESCEQTSSYSTGVCYNAGSYGSISAGGSIYTCTGTNRQYSIETNIEEACLNYGNWVSSQCSSSCSAAGGKNCSSACSYNVSHDIELCMQACS